MIIQSVSTYANMMEQNISNFMEIEHMVQDIDSKVTDIYNEINEMKDVSIKVIDETKETTKELEKVYSLMKEVDKEANENVKTIKNSSSIMEKVKSLINALKQKIEEFKV